MAREKACKHSIIALLEVIFLSDRQRTRVQLYFAGTRLVSEQRGDELQIRHICSRRLLVEDNELVSRISITSSFPSGGHVGTVQFVAIPYSLSLKA